MDTSAHPGKGLSLSQLIFALNAELKRVAYSPSFTLDTISQLDEDASTALATIREWRNSFIPVNHIPSEVLSLIPTHISSQKDRFNASFVCRYWRKANLRHGALWTQIFLSRGEDYVTTLLERARGSPLDIVTHRDVPATIISQISTLAQRIRHLEFSKNSWQDVRTFSEFNSGQLPLLRTLKITTLETPDEVTPPSLPFFRGSANLEEFSLHSGEYKFLSLFIFPNLTTFELSSCPTETFNASLLLDFLQASPMLRVVKLDINTNIWIKDDDQDTVVILPNVEAFSLEMHADSPEDMYDIPAQIQCPCARDASLMVKINMGALYFDEVSYIFPSPDSWDTIDYLYSTTSIEEVVVEMKREHYDAITFSATFLSPDASAIRLGLELSNADERSHPDECWNVFSQTLMTIRQHPSVSHIKRLRIEFRAPIGETIEMAGWVDEVAKLFSSLGPLDRLTIYGCDLQMLFFTSIGFDLKLPHTKELVILHPWTATDHPSCMNSIAGLAKAQHTLGVPFNRVTIRAGILPEGMKKRLKPWVGVVDCRGGYTEEQCGPQRDV